MRYSTPPEYNYEELFKKYFGPNNPREIDYLQYLIDEYELNEWQAKAFPDFVTKLKGGQDWLTQKQNQALIRAIKEFTVFEDDVAKGFLARNYATDVEVKKKAYSQSTKMQQANDSDDFDDDIPF